MTTTLTKENCRKKKHRFILLRFVQDANYKNIRFHSSAFKEIFFSFCFSFSPNQTKNLQEEKKRNI